MLRENNHVPKIGLVPPRELSFFPGLDGSDSPLESFMKSALIDAPGYYWAVYDHALLTATEVFNSLPASGESRHRIDSSFPDPIALLTLLSQITTHNELFTAIMIATQIPVAKLARQSADIANLSRGRFTLGLAPGWSEQEAEGLGVGKEFHNRGSLMEQKIPALEMMLTGIPVNLEIGKEKIHSMGINPKAYYPIKIGIGGGLGPLKNPHTLEVLKRVAKFAEMWMPMGEIDPFLERKPIIEEYLAQYGRNLEDFEYMGRVTLGRKPLDDCVDDLLAWKKAGATHVTLTTVGQGNGDWKFHNNLVRNFMKATQWIRFPEKNFAKAFSLAGGYLAPDKFSLGGPGEFQYGYLQKEVNPRFLILRLTELGYLPEAMDGQEEIKLAWQGETAFIRGATFRGPGGDRVGIFERHVNGREVAVFHESNSST